MSQYPSWLLLLGRHMPVHFCHLKMFIIMWQMKGHVVTVMWRPPSWPVFGVGRVSCARVLILFKILCFFLDCEEGERICFDDELCGLYLNFTPLSKITVWKFTQLRDFYFILIQSSIWKVTWFKVLSCVLWSEFLVACKEEAVWTGAVYVHTCGLWGHMRVCGAVGVFSGKSRKEFVRLCGGRGS